MNTNTLPAAVISSLAGCPLAMYPPAASALELALQAGAAPSSRSPAPARSRQGKIAIVPIFGILSTNQQLIDFLGGTNSQNLAAELRSLAADETIDGVMMMIDSPGGSVAGIAEASDAMAALAAAKPTHAFTAGVTASAAYWLAAACSNFTVGRASIVGSIGTYAVVFDASKMAERIGIKVHIVRAGAHKGAGAFGTEIDADQLAEFQRNVNALNAQFVGDVAKGRRLPLSQAQQLADGRAHIGAEAVTLGLADRVGDFESAMENLQSKLSATAGKPSAAYQFLPAMTAKQEFESLLAAYAKQPRPRGTVGLDARTHAVALIDRHHPGLRARMLAEANPNAVIPAGRYG